MFPSRNNEYENINSSQQEDQPLFLHFHSPFLDEMDTTTILSNLHRNHLSTTSTTTTKKPLKPKCVRNKRLAGKKDRHSKIHTAQGLRDRRMRLSVHTARKFFDLNDMLGFDKASKTIEWLFSKSQKAIEEITETLQSDDATQTVSKENNEMESSLSACETESVMEITLAAEKDEHVEQIEDESSRKPIESYNPLVKELRSEERARARDRTRDRMMIKNLEKPKNLFQTDDPNVEFNESQLGVSNILDNPDMEDQSSCHPLEFSNTYHFLKHLHLDNTYTDTYMGNITATSSTNCSIFDYNKTTAEPPVGWLNSRNTFFGFLGGWDHSQNSRTEFNNEIAPDIPRLTGGMNGQNPSSGIIYSHFLNFHSPNQGE